MDKVKTAIKNLKFLVITCSFAFCVLRFALICLAQEPDLELTLDVTSNTIPLPKIFKPNIDLSGRGFYKDATWPQTVAAKEALGLWQKDIGFSGLYRIQYNLWEISQLSKDSPAQEKLLSNYESIIKNISDADGTVILDIFGTPASLGKILDKISSPRDLKAFRQLIKETIRNLSCNKRYNIWYEVWNAPDLDDFFLGRKQEYLNLYKAVAEAVNELKMETKIHIPVGAPSVSAWFSNLDGNTVFTPEKSLIYELIKFCSHHRLPLDFITWHGYSTTPQAEKGNTIYKKTTVNLIRDWLTYFNFDRNTLLIIDEWNYDRDANVLPERKENSFICASFIPSRIKNMYEAGIDFQLYFSLEDFQNNKEGVVRNVGIFSFDPEHSEYKGSPKSIYNIFRMLAGLGNDMFLPKLDDKFVGAIATKSKDTITLLIYNYIDPDITANYLSQNIASLNRGDRKILLNIIKSGSLKKIILHQLDIAGLRASNKVKALLKKSLELNDLSKKFVDTRRNINIAVKNLKGDYLYEHYVIDSSCSANCEFLPVEQKEVLNDKPCQEALALKPYSVHLIILKNKPKEPQATDTVTPIPSSPNATVKEPNA